MKMQPGADIPTRLRTGIHHPTGGVTMPDPFPGMNPYLEIFGSWRDFHARFIASCSNDFNDRLPDHYVSRIDERYDHPEGFRETWIEIQRLPDQGLVTSIELLSPTNKREPGLSGYLARRTNMIARPNAP